MRTRDVFLDLLSPGLVRARRERLAPSGPATSAASLALPVRPCPELIARPLLAGAAR